MNIDWVHEIADQLDWHWRERLRPRLAGLTDEEYFWEPAPGCWTVRPRRTDREMGGGRFTVDYARPAPVPAPLTTIAWRMAHLTVHVLAKRAELYFGGSPIDYDTHVYAETATAALDQLDGAYAAWSAGMRAATAADLGRPRDSDVPPFAGRPVAAVVLHINREVFHHGGEIALLRDLYLRRPALR
ncbi:DinB family protein [Nocardia terpenica]|uniref:Serine/arginine repetitive matrix protein 1 n=1 Tax=Nocardia terpenica TaxID=455432 RepID=A0A164LKX8_9NOCA|nr:DinB family protein [Nocardia terpenica]KZM72520.1 serine/arginine repetitive matrix protein 1 [Nocardia terpenica]NQE92608.1 DinB family protein [Nocardia terpenica]